MNLLQLVLKQMRQRSLSTWLTMLSVVLGVALAVAVMIIQREGYALFGQTEYGYQVLVGPKGSPLQLTLNTVYQLDRSPGNIPYALYEELTGAPFRPQVKAAIPYAVGDTYKGLRIIGTLPELFGSEAIIEYRPGRKYETAQGRIFHPKKFEAVIGSEVTKLTGLKFGDKFKATHGMPAANQRPDEHEEQWEVVGVLAPTHTAADKNLFIPLISFYTIAEHEEALAAHAAIRAGEDPNKAVAPEPPSPTPLPKEEPHDHDHPATAATTSAPATAEAVHDDHDHDHHHPATAATSAPATAEAAHDEHDDHAHDHPYHLEPDGTIELHVPKEQWEVSAVLVKTRSPFAAQALMYQLNNGPAAIAVNPAAEMRNFFNVFLAPSGRVLLMISLLVTIVAAVAILVSIYNSVAARIREVAILRALGATRQRILAMVCLEAGLIGLLGGIGGLIVGHLLGAAGSAYTRRVVGEGINWTRVGWEEWAYLLIVTAVAVLAGLVPAMKAYRTPVATNLVSG